MKKFFDFIFSMQFAGTLLLIFAAAIGTATFIENDHGVIASQTLVYKAKWFEFLLLLTAVSLVGSVFKYKLYERRRYSVLFFHLAFVVMLAGAALTRYVGYEGTMMIREGSVSSSIISESPYLQLEVSKDGQTYRFDKEVLFTHYGKNRFKDRFSAGGDDVRIQFKGYIPNAAEAVVEDPAGAPIFSFVTVDKGNRKTSYLKSGNCITTSGLTLCFDLPAVDTSAILVSYSDTAGLRFVAPTDVTVMNMMAGTTDTLLKGMQHPLDAMKLYSFGDIQVVVRTFYKAGKTQIVSSPHETSGVGAAVMDLIYHGKRKEVAVIGGKGMIGQPTVVEIDGDRFSLSYGSRRIDLPFAIALRDFQLERYPGSQSPSSFASEVTVVDRARGIEMPYRIYMNNILNYGGYRFFQSSYDKDELGTILSVNHDKLGTTVTYFGYAFLAAGLIFNFFSKNSRFRKLARSSTLARRSGIAAMILLFLLPLASFEKASAQHGAAMGDPINIDPAHARKFGELVVQDRDGRMKPVSTLSSEVLRKVSRKDNILGMNSDQVFLGMSINPGYWQGVPMIKVSDKQLRELIGISGKMASFNDFLDMGSGAYKLSRYVEEAHNKKPVERNSFDKDIIKVDERVNIVYMVYTGDFLTLFPEPGHPNYKWHTASDAYTSFDSTDAGFVSSILPVYYGEVVAASQSNDWGQADVHLGYIKTFQKKYGGDIMPPVSKTRLEIAYNNVNIFKRLFPFYSLFGLIFLVMLFVGILKPGLKLEWLYRTLTIIILAAFLVHTIGLAIRWHISGHAPWSNGYETMIYIAWGTVLSGLLFSQKSKITLATTAILASVTLMVANLSWLDPEITNLVPVLKSYWLVVHVAVITASYSFLGVGALLGLLNLVLIIAQNKRNYNRLDPTVQELTNINEMNLIIGVFLITIGTFLGAVWANESWGRYWGWDPKETWALVTVLVYSFIIHMRLIPGLSSVYAFNFAALTGFSSVLMTYFGVNYYLSGLHSYAAGDPIPIPTFVYYAVATVVIISVWAYINHSRMEKVIRQG
jgi:cytochrome c-type biogenesis protein CcsB